MSYILEALKKAQAERQLSSAPTIHALPIQAGPTHAAGGARAPLWIALGVAALAGAGGAAWWFQAPPAPLAPAPVQVVQQAVVAPPPAPPVAMPAPPAPVFQAPAPVAVRKPPPAPRAVPAPQIVPAETAPLAPAAEDALPFARDLPESVRASLPQVTLGGYMYSKNPADRLILIGKSLRHEGEEVAPGLVLEKLMPKAAVMNYRGTRYRVAY